MRRRTAELLKAYGLDVDPSATLGQLSSPVQQLVAIIRAVDISGKVLILDEPTASLDAAEVELLFSAMRRLRDQGMGHRLRHPFPRPGLCRLRPRDGAAQRPPRRREGDRRDLAHGYRHHDARPRARAGRAPRPARTETAGEPRVAFRNFGAAAASSRSTSRSAPARLGVAGLLGSGRTETARLVFGADRADTGEGDRRRGSPAPRQSARRDPRGLRLLPQERKVEGIVGDLSVRENIILALQARRGWAKPCRCASRCASPTAS